MVTATRRLAPERHAAGGEVLHRVGHAPSDVEAAASPCGRHPTWLSVHLLPGSARPWVPHRDDERLNLSGGHLQAIRTPGHTPGHLCFYEYTRRLLLSGDHGRPKPGERQERKNPL